jgi:basic membrane protein A
MVSATGSFDDKSYTQTAYSGLQRAVTELSVEQGTLQGQDSDNLAGNVQSLIDSKCDIVIGVGYQLTEAIEEAAKLNPEVDFVIVDGQSSVELPNLKPLLFNTNESSFLAGYLAAATTNTKTVATFGAENVPDVTIFMDGFVQGVAYYNLQKGDSVKVIGWDQTAQDGALVASSTPYSDAEAGKVSAQTQISQGADVLFPVAGLSGTGAIEIASQSNGEVSVIWVDTDGCEMDAAYCPYILTSVYKALDDAVFQAIQDSSTDKFTSEAYIGNLANKGTGLSDYHNFDSKILNETKAEIEQIASEIADSALLVPSQAAHRHS